MSKFLFRQRLAGKITRKITVMSFSFFSTVNQLGIAISKSSTALKCMFIDRILPGLDKWRTNDIEPEEIGK